jgi:hypothetical protein
MTGRRQGGHRLVYSEDAFDWSAPRVPSAISPEEEAKAKREQEEEQRSERKAGMGKALGGVVEKTGSEKTEEEIRGSTPEMRQSISQACTSWACISRARTSWACTS